MPTDQFPTFLVDGLKLIYTTNYKINDDTIILYCESVPNLLQKIASRAGSGSLLPGSDHQKKGSFPMATISDTKTAIPAEGAFTASGGFHGFREGSYEGAYGGSGAVTGVTSPADGRITALRRAARRICANHPAEPHRANGPVPACAASRAGGAVLALPILAHPALALPLAACAVEGGRHV